MVVRHPARREVCPLLILAKLAASFALIIILLRRKVPLGPVMLIAAAFLGLIFGVAPRGMASALVRGAVSPSTLNLVLALAIIMLLEGLLRRTGTLQRMVSSLSALTGDTRVSMAVLPALIGFLPSAGGAVFSAPLVEEIARDTGYSAERKSFINYWYRHVWEYILPIYPSVILASEVLRVRLGELVVPQIPLSLAMILAGAPLVARKLASAATAGARSDSVGTPSAIGGIQSTGVPGFPRAAGRKWEHARDLAAGLSPILVVLVLTLGFKLDISLSVGAVFLACLVVFRYRPAQVVELARESFSVMTLFLVLGVMIFKEMLAETGVARTLPALLESVGLAPAVMVFLLPFTVSLMTGLASAAVGITYPIIAGIVNPGVPDPGLIALMGAGMVGGTMLSPVHLCLALTVQYFKADLTRVYRMLYLPQAAIWLVAVGEYFWR